jgi:hypothetical protein
MDTSAASLQIAALRGRPVTMAETRLMEVPGVLAGLFPEGGIRRGTTVGVGSQQGGFSLVLALASAVTVGGGWVAAVGLPSLGLVAAAELGVRLDHLALIPEPGDHWAVVVAALVDGFDLVLLRPPGRVRPVESRRLVARAREKGTVLVVLGGGWPESPDLHLTVARSDWSGLGDGHGYLQARRMEVVLTGRRAAARERRCSLWLPGPAPVSEPVRLVVSG